LPGQGEAAGLPELLGELGADAGVGLRHGVGGSLSPPGLRSAGACRAEVGCDFLGTDSSTGFVARGRGEERGNGARVKEPRDWRGARFTSMLEISGSGSFPARNSRHTMGVVLGGARRQALLDVGWGSVVPRRCCERRTWGGGGGGGRRGTWGWTSPPTVCPTSFHFASSLGRARGQRRGCACQTPVNRGRLGGGQTGRRRTDRKEGTRWTNAGLGSAARRAADDVSDFMSSFGRALGAAAGAALVSGWDLTVKGLEETLRTGHWRATGTSLARARGGRRREPHLRVREAEGGGFLAIGVEP